LAVPPLPDTPCVRVRVSGPTGIGTFWGVRFYLAYAGSAPTGANCTTLAGDIASAWTTSIRPLYPAYFTQNEVDVLDIATNLGLSGQDTTSHGGTLATTALPTQVATNIEFNIAQRYRGGKPRMYLPGGSEEVLLDQGHYQPSFITTCNTNVAAFFTALAALSVGSMGALKHVVLSYYQGFTNYTPAGKRYYSAPTYRTPNALHFDVKGYSAKALLSTQDRRRTSLTR
jgi:hypothetical protein